MDSARKVRRGRWVLWSTGAVLLATYVVLMFVPVSNGPIEVGPDTTYLLGPVRPDGTVDYAATINEESRRGVTPDNNAVVPLLLAAGPKAILPEVRERMYRELGIAPLPESGEYMARLRKAIEAMRPAAESDDSESAGEETVGAVVDRIEYEEWLPGDRQIVEVWVEENVGPFEQLIEAARRPRWYWPKIYRDPSRPGSSQSALSLVNDAAEGLVIRSRLRLAQERPEEAWADIDAACRLVRLMAGGRDVLDFMTSASLESLTLRQLLAIMEQPRLTPDLLRRMASDLDSLPERPEIAEGPSRDRRIMVLDSIQYDPPSPEDFPEEIGEAAAKRLALAIDTNEAMRQVNDWADRLRDTLAVTGSAARIEAYEKLDAQFELAEVKRTGAIGTLKLRAFVLPPIANCDIATEVVALYRAGLLFMLDSVLGSEAEAAAQFHIARLSVALRLFRSEHGIYPKDLRSLVQDLVRSIPTDPFTDGPLLYRSDNGGFILYSVGRDGVDQGGKKWTKGEMTSDIVLQITE